MIARDNESCSLIYEIEKQKERLFALAKFAIKRDEPDASWQIAWRLGEIKDRFDNVEAYLLEFLNDNDEYVRRIALTSLAQIGSPKTEAWAEIAWKTGDEYQRMTALDALHKVSSSRLGDFIVLAKQDGRKYLVDLAMELST